MAASAMASANEFLLLLNASCGPCADLGPPPDAILRIPPPPLPSFLQRPPPPPPPPPSVVTSASKGSSIAEEVIAAAVNATSAIGGAASDDNGGATCSAQCEWGAAGPGGVQYVELPRQGPAAGDTWLLVLIASSAGVLLLGALLALLLLKCRVQRAGKAALHVEPSALRHAKSGGGGVSGGGASASAASGFAGGGGGGATCSAAASSLSASTASGAPCGNLGLYPPGGGGGVRRSHRSSAAASHGDPCADGRVLWAALTPRGTTRHHFARPPLSSAAPRPPSPLYEAPIYEAPPGPPPLGLPLPPPPRGASFDNGAYVEEAAGGLAAALAGGGYGGGGGGESFALAERCSPAPPPRPRVSSPTRIEHPNLPPLNLIPTLPRPRRSGAHNSSAPTIPGAHTLGPPTAAPVVL